MNSKPTQLIINGFMKNNVTKIGIIKIGTIILYIYIKYSSILISLLLKSWIFTFIGEISMLKIILNIDGK